MHSQPRALRGALRRGLALAAATAVGLLAVGFVSAPASAQTASVTGSFVCDRKTSEYVVTWTVANDYHEAATVTRVLAEPADAEWTTELPTEIAAAVDEQTPTTVTGVQRLPGTATEASLDVHVAWPDGSKDHGAAALTLRGDCTPKPSAEIVLTCETLTITLKNEGKAGVTFSIYLKVDDGEYELVDERWVKPGETVVLPDDEEALAAKRTALTAADEQEASAPVVSIKVVAEYMKDVEASLDLAECEEPEPSESPSPSETVTASPSPVGEVPSTPAPPAPSSGGSLPVTGASVGGLAVGALAVLGVGIALTLLGRRRKQS